MSIREIRRPGRPVSAGLVVLAVVSAVLLMGSANPEGPRIQEVVRGAIDDAMDAGTYKAPGWTTGRLDEATLAAMHATLDRRLKEHMTGRALAGWQRDLHAAIDRDSDGEHVIVTAGGVDQIEFESVTLDGDSARANGRAHLWATWVIHKAGVPGPQSGHPEEWDDFAATLVRVNDAWFVDSLTLDPEGGGG